MIHDTKSTRMASSLENLETQLELFIENVRQIRIIVGDFQPQGQNVLNQKMYVLLLDFVQLWGEGNWMRFPSCDKLLMFEVEFLLSLGVSLGFDVFHFFSQALVHGLQEVDKLKSQVQEVHVPLEVFE